VSWTWEDLADAVRRLELPRGEYVVGANGSRLARHDLDWIDDAELIVTERGWNTLVDQGWPWLTDALHHPDIDPRAPRCGGLIATRSGAGRTYRAKPEELVARAAWVDGLPVVPPDLLQATNPSRFEVARRHLAASSAGVVLLALAFGYGIQILFGAGLQHLAFLTTEVNVTVTDRDGAGYCGGGGDPASQRKPQSDLTLTWTRDGDEHSAVHRVCDTDLLEGDRTSAWVTPGDDVAALYSPWLAHLYAWALPLFMGVVGGAALLVAFVARKVKRARAEPR